MTEAPTYWTDIEDPWFLYRLIDKRGWYSNARTRSWVEDAGIFGQVKRRGGPAALPRLRGESLDQVSRSRAGEIAKQLKIVLDSLDGRSPRKDSYRYLIESMETEPRYWTDLDRPMFLYRLIGVYGWCANARTRSWEPDFDNDSWEGDTICGRVDGMAGNFYDMISQYKARQIAKQLEIVLDRYDNPPKRRAAR